MENQLFNYLLNSPGVKQHIDQAKFKVIYDLIWFQFIKPLGGVIPGDCICHVEDKAQLIEAISKMEKLDVNERVLLQELDYMKRAARMDDDWRASTLPCISDEILCTAITQALLNNIEEKRNK